MRCFIVKFVLYINKALAYDVSVFMNRICMSVKIKCSACLMLNGYEKISVLLPLTDTPEAQKAVCNPEFSSL